VKIDLPQFRPTAKARNWVKKEIDTARFIQAFWNAAGQRRKDPKFLSLIVRCGWLTKGKDRESTRKWRNRNIADYLQVAYESDDQLARDLSRVLPRLKQPATLLRMNTGITNYHPPLRPATLEFVERHHVQVAAAFKIVSEPRTETAKKIRQAVETLTELGYIRTLGRKVSPLNGLTPTLACLDPARVFPIVNVRTERLLRVIGKEHNADGAVGLSLLIGLNGIKNSFELDVYAATADFGKIKSQRNRLSISGRKVSFRNVGLKSEIDSVAQIAASHKRIRKLHNALTNRLRNYLLWRYAFQENQFDGLIPDWKPGRNLLIEAKTASEGSGGRTQIRQAIGQLFDYRHKFFRNEKAKVDLAVLLASEPSADIRALLDSLGIYVLWFSGKDLKGSVKL
jgi:hypothetical protein